MKNSKENGITLIALIITIIVMLILAAVTVSMVVGENGVLSNATESAEKTDIAETKEEIQYALVGRYDNKGKYTVQDVLDSVKEVTGNEADESAGTVLTEAGSIVDISDLLQNASDYVEDITPPTVEIATSSETDSITVTVNASDDNGIKSYQYYLGEELKETLTTGEYTYLNLTAGTEYTIKIIVTDNYGNYTEKSKTETTTEVVSLIEFTIDGKTCQAEDGMTWKEWRNSSYNELDVSVWSSYVVLDAYTYSGLFTLLGVVASVEPIIIAAPAGDIPSNCVLASDEILNSYDYALYMSSDMLFVTY